MESHSALGDAVLGEELTLGEGMRPLLGQGSRVHRGKSLKIEGRPWDLRNGQGSLNKERHI